MVDWPGVFYSLPAIVAGAALIGAVVCQVFGSRLWLMGSTPSRMDTETVGPSAIEIAMKEIAMKHFGITVEIIDELRMLYYVYRFHITPPIGGRSTFDVICGTVEFTAGARCAVISGEDKVIVLDRELGRGVCLTAPTKAIRSLLRGNTLQVTMYRPGPDWKTNLEEYEINLHGGEDDSLVPQGWVGTAEVFPALGDAP